MSFKLEEETFGGLVRQISFRSDKTKRHFSLNCYMKVSGA